MQHKIDTSGIMTNKALAEALGVTASRASQIVKAAREEAKQTAIAMELIPAPATAETGTVEEPIEDQLNKITNELELLTMKALKNKIEHFSFGAKPMELAKVALMLNGMKRRSGGPGGLGDLPPGANLAINDNRVVHLELRDLPPKPSIVTDRSGQIIESNGRTLITASKEAVLAAAATVSLESLPHEGEIENVRNTDTPDQATTAGKYSLVADSDN